MPDTQERVGVAGATLTGRRYPVPPSLEGIAGQGNPSPGFPGEQAGKVDGQARLVGAGDRLNKGIAPFGLRPVRRRAQQACQDDGVLGAPCALRPVQGNQGPSTA